MRLSKKIIPAIVLTALVLSMAPLGISTAHAQADAAVGSATYADPLSSRPPPVNTQLSCSAGIEQCLAQIMYYIGPGLAGYVAYIGAYFFSIVIQLSLNSTAYALQFLTDGWTTVRDIANMAFIFILIYIAMMVMLQAETAGTIKTLAIVVVIALLVNFSFFFTRVVIDAGNILALQFYNAIPAVPGVAPINGVKDLSGSLMGAVGPQVLLSSAMFDKAKNATGNSAWAVLGVYTVIFLSVAAMLWMLFFTFIQVGIKFMLRIVGLWFILIASPLAFVARTMPKTKPYFDEWFKRLIQYSLYPAIFLFMFLILTRFASSLNGPAGGSLLNAVSHSFDTIDPSAVGAATTPMGVIASVAIRMGFIIALMYVALHVSEWVVKEGSGLASKVTGWSTGKAFGAVGFGGRNIVGWAAQRASETAMMRNLAAKGGVLGRTLWRGTGALGSSTFDARGLPGIRTGIARLGVDVGEASQKTYKESYDARIERREKESKALKPSEGQLFTAISGEVKKLSPEDKQKLMNAAGTLAQVKEDRANNDATNEDVKKATAAYKAVLKDLDIKDKIKEAKEKIGSQNAKTYADAITTKDWRNVWGAASGIPLWIGKADKEAAAKIRGSKADADQMKNILSALDYKVEEGYETPEPPRTPGGGGGGGTPGGGGGGGPAGAGGGRGPGTGPQPAPPAGGWQFPQPGGTTSYGGPATVSLSKEDRELFRKTIKTIRTSSEINSQGFSDIARKISNGASTASAPHTNETKTGGGKPATNDNTQKPLKAENDNEPLGENREAA